MGKVKSETNMNCSKMRNLIVDYHYKESSSTESSTVVKHMDLCSDCTSYYQELVGMLDTVSDCPVDSYSQEQVHSAVQFATGPVSRLEQLRWSIYELLSPAGQLLLPGLVSGLLCALTLGPVMLGDMSIKMSSELLLISAVLWASVYTTLVSAIFNDSFSKSSSHINMRVLVYSVFAGCFIMNASLYMGLKGGLFSGSLVHAMSIHLPKALGLCSSLAILVVATIASTLEDRYILSTMLSIVALYLAINIPVFFCVAGMELTLFSVLNFIGMVVASGLAGVLLGGLLKDVAHEFSRKTSVRTEAIPHLNI